MRITQNTLEVTFKTFWGLFASALFVGYVILYAESVPKGTSSLLQTLTPSLSEGDLVSLQKIYTTLVEEGGWANLLRVSSYYSFPSINILGLVFFALNVTVAFRILIRRVGTNPSLINKLLLLSFSVLLLYANTGASGNWHHLIGAAFTDIQKLHSDLYWVTIEAWLTRIEYWSSPTYYIVGGLVGYAIVKAYSILRYYDTGKDYQRRLSTLVSGCALAAFAPYRMSQSIELLQDKDSLEEMAVIRGKTLQRLFLYNKTMMNLNIALAKDNLGFIALSDLSSTYIVSYMQKMELSPR